MSDDDPEQEQTADEHEAADDREEREHRREDDTDKENVVSDDGTGSDNTPVRPDQPESANRTVDGKNKEQLDVPQITVDRASRLDSVEQIAESPTGDRPVQVPQIQTRSTAVLDADDMVDTILVESETSTTDVPQFIPETIDMLTPVELDDDQLEGIERVQQVQVPQVTVENRARIHPFSTFLETVPEITAENTDMAGEEDVGELVEEEEQATVDTIHVTESEVDALNELGAGDEWATGEWPDPLELLFGSGGADVKSANPMVVLVDDYTLVGVVETLVKRRYREIEGGEPELQKFDTANQLADEERWMSADNRIFTAQLPDEEWEKLEDDEYQEEWQSIWRNRFDQLFSGQQFGAIIFNRSKVPGPEVTSLPHHPPTLVELEHEVNWKDIARAFWTNLDAVNARRTQTFSQVFDRDANGVAQDWWIQILQAADGMFDLATDGDDAASDEHYALKVFVVKWLAEQLWEENEEFTEYDALSEIEDYRKIEDTIYTEQPVPVSDGDPVKPDVRYGSWVFEVEMFFEEADESGVGSKLQQTVRKYEEVKRPVDAINIVVNNLTCLLHLKDFAQFKRNHRYWEEEYADINLYTVDLGREELVPVNEIVNELTEISLR